MKLHLNKTLRAALIAAITAVGFTLPQSFADDMQKTLFNFGASALPEGTTNSVVFTNDTITATLSSTANLLQGTWDSPGLTIDNPWTADSLNALVGDQDIMGTKTSFIRGGGNGKVMTLTIGGLEVGGTYDIVILAGRPKVVSGSWPALTTSNDYSSSSRTLGEQNINVNNINAIAIQGIEANASGAITFTLTGNSHEPSFAGVALLQTGHAATAQVWNGTEDSHDWSGNVWNDGEAFVKNGEALFNSSAQYHGVDITTAVAAKNVTVDGVAYTFDIGAEGSLATNNLTITTGGSLTLKGTMEVAGAVTVADEHSLIVNEGAVLKVTSESAAKTLLPSTGVVNSGTVEVADNVTIGDSLTSKMGGTVTVADGKKLTLGTTKDSHSINLTSLDALVLGQGANLDTKALKVDIKNLTANGSTLKMLDTKDKNTDGVVLHGTTTLKGNLTITGDWKYKINIEKLAGTGSLELTGGNEEHRAVIGDVSINSLTVTNKMTNVDITGTVALSGVLGVNGTTNVTGQNTMTVGGLTGSAALNVSNGITFNVAEGGAYSYTGTLTVGGQIVKQGLGTQTISGTALKHTVLAQAGTLVLSGDYAIDDIAESEIVNTTVDYEGNESANGYHKSSGTITVYSGEGSLNLDAAHFKFANGDVTDAVKEGNGKYTLEGETEKSTVYVTKGALDIANYKTDALTSVELSDGTTVNMDTAITVGVKLAEGATATVNATEATTISSISGTGTKLIVTGDDIVTLASASTMTTAVEIGGTATVKLGNAAALGNTSGVIVHTGATLDVNGAKDQTTCIAVTLAGGTLANTGNEASHGSKQLIKDLTVTENSKVNAAANNFGVINGGYATTTLTLNATLEKVGSHDFHLANTTVTGDGAIKVTEGAVWFGRADGAAIGSYASDFIMNGGNVKGRLALASDISVTTEAEGGNFSANVTNNGYTITFDGDYDLTASGVISGEGGIIKDGEGTLTLQGTQTYTGTTVVNGGKLVVEGTLADDSAISVEGDATIDGNVDTTQVGIAAGKTATFEQGISDASGVTFSSVEGGVDVKNTNAEGPAIKYSIDEENAKVTADELVAYSDGDPIVVNNEVNVSSIANWGDAALTLTHIGTETQLESIANYGGQVTLQGVTTDPITLADMTIDTGSTVAVYTDNTATSEGTVTINDTLTAGGGTLKANLTLVGDSTLDLSLMDGGMEALTLGSTLTINTETGLINLDDATLAALDALDLGASLTLVKALDQTSLAYGEGGAENYTGTWYGQMFNREGEQYSLIGDYQVFSTEQGFGLTKVSNVPEPTTGTLSLLALMALAARRRRK